MTHDPVNKPSHYNQAGIEVIEVIETYTPNSPHLANVLKYVCRHSYKGKPLEDLKKAQWYLNRYIENYERELCRELTELSAELYDDPARPDTIMVPVITDIHEPDEQYVTPSLERVPGSDGPVHRDYYNFDPDEVEGYCANCGEPILKSDAKITVSGNDKMYCSLACAAEDKFWEDGE